MVKHRGLGGFPHERMLNPKGENSKLLTPHYLLFTIYYSLLLTPYSLLLPPYSLLLILMPFQAVLKYDTWELLPS